MVILEEIRSSRRRDNLNKRLKNLANKTGYEIIQSNGQRVYAPATTSNICAPPKGCEVFIGKLPRTIFEDELIPLFENIGPLYNFRMMLDFTEGTRGYAFATYFNIEYANKAIEKLNNYEIRSKRFIVVYKSVDNCRLFVGNLPLEKSRQEVYEALTAYAPGIVDVIMFQNLNDCKLNRGFVFLEFENHRYAAMARRQFAPNNLTLWDQNIYVDWADPLPCVDQKIMSQVTILYLSNVPFYSTSHNVRACVSKRVNSQIITKVYKNSSYAFIHFNSRSSAEYAYSKLQNLEILGHNVTVEWARPPGYSKKCRLSRPPDHCCISVPPSSRKWIHFKRENPVDVATTINSLDTSGSENQDHNTSATSSNVSVETSSCEEKNYISATISSMLIENSVFKQQDHSLSVTTLNVPAAKSRVGTPGLYNLF